ncbi:hypothetical protein QUA86_27575, partial [Microcoleus sp. F6_B6]
MAGKSGSTNRFFFIKQATGTEQGRPRTVQSCIGELIITEKQVEKLDKLFRIKTGIIINHKSQKSQKYASQK